MKSELYEYAKSELKRLEDTCDADGLKMQKQMDKHILKMIKVFAKEGHSGFSANYALNMFDRLAHFKPLTPLTGEDDEWNDRQNARCSSVFKYDDGTITDIDAAIVSDNGGVSFFYNKELCDNKVVFPYFPPAHPAEKLVEYNEKTGKYTDITNNPNKIKKLREKYLEEIREATDE